MFTLANPTYNIRSPQNKAEWDVVKKLLLEYKQEFNEDTCFTSFEEEMADLEKYYAADDKGKLIAVADADGAIAGCVAYKTFSPGVCELKRLYVDPLYRGHQLGRKLAEAVIEYATSHGFKKIILDTMVEMKAAQQLYHQLGFDIIPPYNDQDANKLICFGKTL